MVSSQEVSSAITSMVFLCFGGCCWGKFDVSVWEWSPSGGVSPSSGIVSRAGVVSSSGEVVFWSWSVEEFWSETVRF